MTQERIEPHKVTTPIQLLAVWFVALIALDAAFLTAAGIVETPEWLPTVLVVAAILNVPIFLGCMFLLQTRFRPEMQADWFYADHLKEKRKASNLADEVREQMTAAGLDLSDLVRGRSMNDKALKKIRPIVDELKDAVNTIHSQASHDGDVDPMALRALGQGHMAVGNWLAAAKALEEYGRIRPDDLDANYSRGVAYANSRGGHETDLASLRAYNDTITFAPKHIDDNTRARFFAYRGAMFKRLNRLAEAEADLRIAESLATDDYEVNDIKYNLAGVYALRGDRDKMMDMVTQLQDQPGMLMGIRAHLDDYFAKYADDQEFLAAISAT